MGPQLVSRGADLGLPGLVTPPWKDMRIILLRYPTISPPQQTQHQLLAVFSWSMQCLFKGLFPPNRHDGEAWKTLDTDRAKKAGRNLGLEGLLCQLQGDWKAFKEVFGLLGWHPGVVPFVGDAVQPGTTWSTRGTTLLSSEKTSD